MLLPLLGYFFCMVAVLTAAVGVMIGLFNISTSGRVRHYPRPVVERDVTATKTEPRLFMVVPETKDGSSANYIKANSAAVPTEKVMRWALGVEVCSPHGAARGSGDGVAAQPFRLIV
jgi:hypothetical protein